MQERWVSFSEVKRQVSLADVLAHYGLLERLRQSGDELAGPCPFHEEREGSFRASISKNAFQCFGCGRKGNVLDFVAAREGVNIRQSALLLQEWFGSASPMSGLPTAPRIADTARSAPTPRCENKPLRFTLRDLDPTHPYLAERGLRPETVAYFGVGYCSHGLLKGRIAIPIHDELGYLVAYAGRWPGEPPEAEPRYKLPSNFHKSQVLYNLHRAARLAREEGLVVVEGYVDTFKVHQAGFPNVVALMGSVLSERQRELLVEAARPSGKITLWFDEDKAGRRCLEQSSKLLSGQMDVHSVRLGRHGVQPDQLGEDEIRQVLG